jgi:hypothetical protein
MKRTALSLLGCLTVASGLVFAQGTPPPQQPQQQQNPPAQDKQQKPDVTLTGCVTQGSSPTVFILDNARLNVDDRGEKGKIYMLVSAAEDLNFAKHLNHEVSVTGTADQKTMATPATGQKVEEKDLPKLSAKSLISVADKCSTAK